MIAPRLIITSYPAPSSLNPNSHISSSIPFSAPKFGSLCLTAGALSSSGVRLFSHSRSSSISTIRSAATKPVKSPAEEDWKIKREYLLQKRVRSVDVKEALRLQNENNFVILDVRPEADFKEVSHVDTDWCRSLIAAYLLVLNGYTNVFHLEGGLYSWFKEGLPAVAEE
ncbi:rhodanese-like domain-containing protein 14, chloroplastic [Macadamia integrifolia]|uniref:rhodanese-like domain-containing protein 14, chloroplastic n=1 Tax=Macadamia integrifolia TaxID=60698 RepID=UPI001C4EBED7|nr:rhodanese-like domain-containing protein 14, chloroplastic [Macadamia integrifolia]